MFSKHQTCSFFNTAKFLLSFTLLVFFVFSCSKPYTEEELEYIANISRHREDVNNFMKDNPDSPFNFKGIVEFHPLKYFDVDPDFLFYSRLFENDLKDTVTIFGTKGEARIAIRYGYLQFPNEGIDYKLNIYENNSKSGDIYYSIWFTDKTTNNESYGVGRYLNFEKVDDPEHIYKIDFNLAYNPYCAYTKNYSCAIPTKEDYLDLAVKAGEKKFHD